MARMYGATFGTPTCNYGRHCSCQPNKRAQDFVKRSNKRQEERAWRAMDPIE